MSSPRSKMEKYAEKYFSDNGFEFESKEEKLWTEYIVHKDDICMKWLAIKSEHRYKQAMDSFDRDWNVLCQYHRMKAFQKELDRKYESVSK